METNKNNNKEPGGLQYMPIGMCIGIGIGMAVGAAMDNIGVGMCMGMSIGMCFGIVMDSMQKKKAEEKSETEGTEE